MTPAGVATPPCLVSEFQATDGGRRIALARGHRSATIAGHDSIHGLARRYADSAADSMATMLARTCVGPPHSHAGEVLLPPVAPHDLRAAHVIAFGYTHRLVNSLPVARGDIDFYHKGDGRLLRVDGCPIEATGRPGDAGIEAEYCAIYIVDQFGNPRYIGYTVANDYSEVKLRKRYRGLAELSKLAPTGLGGAVALAPVPRSGTLTARIHRDRRVLWERSGQSGAQAMLYHPRTLERVAFARRHLFAPGDVVYLLLGSCIGSHRDAIDLERGDIVEIVDRASGIRATNTIA